jgi:alginate O-acetyltransferase complex protein AlgI
MLIAWLLTMLSVIIAWVVFRAETLQGAGRILLSMVRPAAGEQVHALLWNAGLSLSIGGLWCGALSAVACLGLNSNRIGNYLLNQDRTATKALISGASFAAVAFMLIVNITRDSVSSFIYFNF